MAKDSSLRRLLAIAMWIVGVLISLAVGFGMVDGILTVRWIPLSVTVIAGWIVVILTVIGVLLAIADRF